MLCLLGFCIKSNREAYEIHCGVCGFPRLEAEIDWMMTENDGQALHISVYGDLLRGKNESDNSNLPRIPPARVGISLEVKAEKYGFGLHLDRVSDQYRVQEGSPSYHIDIIGGVPVIHYDSEPFTTEGYTLLNAFYTYTFNFGQVQSELYVRGSNLGQTGQSTYLLSQRICSVARS